MTPTKTVGDVVDAAALVVDPRDGETFDGTLNEAADALVEFASYVRLGDGDRAASNLARMLRNAQPDRVAEIAAVALLRLATTDDAEFLARRGGAW